MRFGSGWGEERTEDSKRVWVPREVLTKISSVYTCIKISVCQEVPISHEGLTQEGWEFRGGDSVGERRGNT